MKSFEATWRLDCVIREETKWYGKIYSTWTIASSAYSCNRIRNNNLLYIKT